MQIETIKPFVVGKHRYSFRPNESAEVIGAIMVRPNRDIKPRLCLKIKYADGFVDYMPIANLLDGTAKLTDVDGNSFEVNP